MSIDVMMVILLRLLLVAIIVPPHFTDLVITLLPFLLLLLPSSSSASSSSPSYNLGAHRYDCRALLINISAINLLLVSRHLFATGSAKVPMGKPCPPAFNVASSCKGRPHKLLLHNPAPASSLERAAPLGRVSPPPPSYLASLLRQLANQGTAALACACMDVGPDGKQTICCARLLGP